MTPAEALRPGQFIRYGASWNFISGLEDVAGQIGKLMREDAERAMRLYETFLAGCYEKAEEVDDSGGNLGMFVGGLYSALTWVDRGLAFDKKQPHGSKAGYDLAKVKRELLTKLGRSRDALEQAWSEFCEHPSKYSYEELLRFVPKDDRSVWHAKAMEAAERADLGSLIQLWLETKEIDRLGKRLREAKDTEIEGLSHYTTEPAAKRLAKSHPDVAAKVYRALGMRILNAKKSKYYDAALSNFEDAKRYYERAGLAGKWDAIVAEVRQGHNRKVGFMGGFERLVAGCGPSEEPSFLDRARRRWLPEGQQ
jgi:hypothetical protein